MTRPPPRSPLFPSPPLSRSPPPPCPRPPPPRRHVEPPPLRDVGTTEDLPVQQPAHDHAEEAVQQREREKRDNKTRHRRHRVPRLHHSVNHQRLPPQLGNHPGSIDSDESHRCRERDSTHQPADV